MQYIKNGYRPIVEYPALSLLFLFQKRDFYVPDLQ